MEDLGILKWSGGLFSFKIKNVIWREKCADLVKRLN